MLSKLLQCIIHCNNLLSIELCKKRDSVNGKSGSY
jgi:hypothetical protein